MDIVQDVAIVKKKEKIGAVDLRGKVIIPNRYDSIEYGVTGNYFYARMKGKEFHFDMNGKKMR